MQKGPLWRRAARLEISLRIHSGISNLSTTATVFLTSIRRLPTTGTVLPKLILFPQTFLSSAEDRPGGSAACVCLAGFFEELSIAIPTSPRVRYFTRHLNPLRVRFLDDLKAFIDHPDVGGDDLEVRASWYASYAFTWATLRDFDRAYECIRIAHSLVQNDSWILSLESEVYGMADRWSDALRSAERALEVDPGAPFAIHSLGMALINLGRVEESAARLFAAAESSQSYQLVLDACWHQCAFAETLDGEQRHLVLDQARKLAGRLPGLMPLADREALKSVARTNLDIAELADDYAGIERWAAAARSTFFHRHLLANLARNAEGKRIRLPFRRTIQKHEACVPTSIAAAMSASGMTISADEMAADLTFGGTQEWAAADWLRARGYHVRFFSVTPQVAADLIRNQIAFILCWDAEESGHAVAVIGLDERLKPFWCTIRNRFAVRNTSSRFSIRLRARSALRAWRL